ncbi:uncharacterized protein LOC131819618 [Mustela lutreola]|uniref:uncharacterized protein LOC131819618 n=1 Tax=Mustela lutreola TaxID=9666 RepID=UPI002797663F|nr:uncharacterized protein LOC131819618 [Mustela lutreola]
MMSALQEWPAQDLHLSQEVPTEAETQASPHEVRKDLSRGNAPHRPSTAAPAGTPLPRFPAPLRCPSASSLAISPRAGARDDEEAQGRQQQRQPS